MDELPILEAELALFNTQKQNDNDDLQSRLASLERDKQAARDRSALFQARITQQINDKQAQIDSINVV